jgi:hypothetical protein
MTRSDTQTSLRLPRELYERLSEAAAGNDRGVGEEMRQRLEASFGPAPEEDPKTRKLLAAIARVANGIRLDGIWHEDLRLFEAFKVAVLTLLSRFEPAGTSSEAPFMWSKPDDPPETIGRVHAGFAWRAVMNEKE